MTPDDLTRLEELANAATPGPWRAVDGAGRGEKALTTASGAWFGNIDDGSESRNAADAAYIAAASPDVVLALVAEVRRRYEPGTDPRIGMYEDILAKDGAELVRLRAIVRDLAACAPLVFGYDGTDGRNCCSLCISDGGRPEVQHARDCPWCRAVEASR
jgi:hypothetical protein